MTTFEFAQKQVAQAEINLGRTRVRSPVDGYVTNLQMRVGDYAHASSANISIIGNDSYWIVGCPDWPACPGRMPSRGHHHRANNPASTSGRHREIRSYAR